MLHAKIKHLLQTPYITQMNTAKGVQALLQLCLQTNCILSANTSKWMA